MGRRLRSRGTKSMPVLSKGSELVASLFLLRFICCALYKANVHSDLKHDVTWYGALYMIISLPSRMSNMKVVSWQPCLLHELKS